MAQTDKQVVTYVTDAGAEVKLSPGIIRRYLVNGNGDVDDQEVMMFLMLCKQQRLDPFLREAYLIKYRNSPATLVTGKEVFTKRAERHPNMRGMVAGVVVRTGKGELLYRPGSLVLEGEEIVGGYAKIWKADREVPYENSVTFEEYVGRTKEGKVNKQWSQKPATMIRKVALVQALREVFPETFSGMYDADEMGNMPELDDTPVPRDVTPHEGSGKHEPAQPNTENATVNVSTEYDPDNEGTVDNPDVTSSQEPDTPPAKGRASKDAGGKAEMNDTIARMAGKVSDEDERNLEIF